MTAAHKEMDESLNRDLYDRIVGAIADSRKKTADEVKTLIDDGPFLPEQALKAGLIDEVAYEDQVADRLGAAGGGDRAHQIDGDDYARVSTSSLGLDRGPRIGVIYVSGEIASGKSGYDPVNGAVLGSDTLIDYIRQARKDTSLRAIVLRIDSPGGSAVGVRRDLARADAGAQGARGSADHRVDVGSRRVRRLLHRDAGEDDRGRAVDAHRIDRHLRRQVRHRRALRKVRRDHRVDQHRRATLRSNRPRGRTTPEELTKVQEQLDAFYDQFVERVADSRHTTPQKIDSSRRDACGPESGEGERARGRARRPRSRRGACQRAREDSRRERRRARRLSAAQDVL